MKFCINKLIKASIKQQVEKLLGTNEIERCIRICDERRYDLFRWKEAHRMQQVRMPCWKGEALAHNGVRSCSEVYPDLLE